MKLSLVLLFCVQALAGGGGGRGATQAYVAPQLYQQPQFFQPQPFQSQVIQPQAFQSQGLPQVFQQPQFFSAPVLSAEVPEVFQPPNLPGPPGGGHGGGHKGGKHGQQAQAVVIQPIVQPLVTETVEERVFRQPISMTVTELPVNVNRIKRNVIQHYPMIHQQVQNHVTVEDEAVQNVIHHYYEPVNRVLPTQQGQNYMTETHVDHPGEMYVDGTQEVVQEIIEPVVQPVIQTSVVQNGLTEDVLAYGEEAIRPYTSASGNVNGNMAPYDTNSYASGSAPYQSSYDTIAPGSAPYQQTSSYTSESAPYQNSAYQNSPYQTNIQNAGSGYESYDASPYDTSSPYDTNSLQRAGSGYQSYDASPYDASPLQSAGSGFNF